MSFVMSMLPSMSTVTSMFSSLMVGTPAAASAPATAGLFGSAGEVTAASILGGTASLFGSMSTIGGISQYAAMMQDQARWADIQARQEELRGLQESNKIKQSLIATMAAQNARWGFAGIDIGSGTPVAAQEAAAREADYQLDTSRDMAAIRAASRRATASRLRTTARSLRSEGYVRGGTSLLRAAGVGK